MEKATSRISKRKFRAFLPRRTPPDRIKLANRIIRSLAIGDRRCPSGSDRGVSIRDAARCRYTVDGSRLWPMSPTNFFEGLWLLVVRDRDRAMESPLLFRRSSIRLERDDRVIVFPVLRRCVEGSQRSSIFFVFFGATRRGRRPFTDFLRVLRPGAVQFFSFSRPMRTRRRYSLFRLRDSR